MKRVLAQGFAMSAVAVMVAACGGSNDSTPTPAPSAAKSLVISGVAATGAALADGQVAVKCATGQGATKTEASGSYSLALEGGVLPCMVAVKGVVDGADITLHSVTDAGTTSNGKTAAVANVTPLTEMVVAKLGNAMPSELFASFSAQTPIQSAQVREATAAVVAALKESAGIDLGTIDPFKSELVPATASAPGQGNAHDKLLDQLKIKVPTEALAVVVNQIANASSAAGLASGEAQPTLADVMAGVGAGSLANCPSALSGKYRMLDYFGRVRVRQLDFKALEFRTADGVKMYDIVPHATEACRFTVSGMYDGVDVSLDVVMGTAGVGAYRLENVTAGSSTAGYIFPLQARRPADVLGEWTVLESGYSPYEAGQDGGDFYHVLTKAKVEAEGKLSFCDYNFDNPTCVEYEGSLQTWSADQNGFFKIGGDDSPARIYFYRAPNGAMTLFGTANPDGTYVPSNHALHFVGTKSAKIALPAVGSIGRFWSVKQSRLQVETNWINGATGPVADSVTNEAVDLTAGTVTRKRGSDNSVETVQFNKPIDGLRLIAGPSGLNAGAAQMVLTGLGMTVTVNKTPAEAPNFGSHFYAISVNRR